MTETHKIVGILSGKTISSFAVAHQKDGWIDLAGKTVHIPASPKKVKFFSNEADAKANGFSPSDVQKAALAAWPSPKTPVLKEPEKK